MRLTLTPIIVIMLLCGSCTDARENKQMPDFAGQYTGSMRLYGGLLQYDSIYTLILDRDSSYIKKSCNKPETGKWDYDAHKIILSGMYYSKRGEADSVLLPYSYGLEITSKGHLAERNIKILGGPFYLKNRRVDYIYRKTD